MTLEPERARRAFVLFDEVVDLPAQERTRRIAEVREEDAELAAELEDLLRADAVSNVAVDVSAVARVDPDLDFTGDFGRWRTLEPLGRGGMGMVWAAERADGQFDQRAALKVLPRALDTPAMRRRFFAERQILARLEHPGIARLLDGGVTPDASPFLVMERVDGEPITDFCDARRLEVAERIEVFLGACEALAVAHRELVVHRDLKPDHLVVTAGGLKLLDFGIAEILDEDPEPGEARTRVHALTPRYAAPEQVRGDPVTTVTDVYALGLVLYELLCGAAAQSFTSRATSEIERVVCDRDPPRPSSRASAAGAEVARARRTSPRRLSRLLAGDLDAIVATALQKSPHRRYPSVEAFAADLRRWLDGRPVHAREPSWLDRSFLFVLRHRWGVAAAGAVLAALVFGAALAFWQAGIASGERDRARQEARKAREVVDLLSGLFEVTDPWAEPISADELTARELVDRAAARLRSELAGPPEVRARLMGVVGEVYKNLGLHDEAEALVRGALDHVRTIHGPDHPRFASALSHLGQLRQEQGEFAVAADLHRQALQIRRARLAEPHLEIAQSELDLGVALSWLEVEPVETERLLRSALATRRQLVPASLAVAYASNTLGNFLADRGRFDEAEAYLRETLEIRRRRIGSDHPSTAIGLNNLAQAMRDAGRFAEAEPFFREANGILEHHLGEHHLYVAIGRNNLGDVLEKQGRWRDAEPVYLSALEALAAPNLEGHPLGGVVRSKWGGALAALGRAAEAETALRAGYEQVRGAFGDGHELTRLARERLEAFEGSSADDA